MKRFKWLLVIFIASISLAGSAHCEFALFGSKPAKYKIMKVNSNKKYLHLMTRTRGILGTSNWGKFNYDVVELPYEKQGEYFTINWKRSGGPKLLEKDLTLRIEYRHQNGLGAKAEKNYPACKRGRYSLTFENTGDPFVDNGEIELWRVSLWVGDQMVAEKESALWWTVAKTQS